MNLKPDGWIARPYFWSLNHREEWARAWDEKRNGSDLCRVVRELLVVMPLLIMGQATFLALAAFAVWVFVSGLFTFLSRVYYDTLVWLATYALPVVWTLGLLAAFWLALRAYAKQDTPLHEAGRVAREWVKAKKGRYCPRVTFNVE